MNRWIPYAVAKYEEIVRDRYDVVDKTRFIHEIERYKIPVFLRPRRFGKSLWCSILECYYDINWLPRLCGGDKEARELVETLMFEEKLPVDTAMLSSKFNMNQFFEQRFFPQSMYYLGMLTFRDRFNLEFPNLTVKKIFT